MRTGTWRTPMLLILAGGLLVLAGVLSHARPALAQAQLDCPLPADMTPPADLRVTAQQVEDGSASLMDFALAVRDQFGQGTATDPQRALYVGCLIRQEGSVYRSGSTYLIQLRFDGRVFVHAKDMSLSGRQLRPAIYGAILEALGIDPTVLTDPAAARAAFAAATAGDGGPFDVPAIPGASGHAAVYVSAKFGSPVVLLVGFDLNASHLVEEDIVHIEPAVTARDVVDRASLKAFVTQAGEFFLALAQRQNGDMLKAKNALRDPNGPWRHGPVYVGVTNRATNLILFHGAFPDRFELRQAGISRDLATGELIFDQLIAAAESSPEGGFWEYYFDNPADDNDSVEVPKVGYARIFTGSYRRRSDGAVFPISFVVNSGFYLGSDGSGALVGALENPEGPHSFQSGVSALRGWVCDATMVEIEIETAQGEVQPYVAEYSLERLDTLDTCGDTDNGFALLFNWNRLGAGEHTVTALVDGVELGRATVQVTTLGEGAEEEFLRGVVGECVAADFPMPGQTTTLEWQQSQQNFVITEVE